MNRKLSSLFILSSIKDKLPRFGMVYDEIWRNSIEYALVSYYMALPVNCMCYKISTNTFTTCTSTQQWLCFTVTNATRTRSPYYKIYVTTVGWIEKNFKKNISLVTVHLWLYLSLISDFMCNETMNKFTFSNDNKNDKKFKFSLRKVSITERTKWTLLF